MILDIYQNELNFRTGIFRLNAGVMKLVDFRSLEVRVRKSVGVRVPPSAPICSVRVRVLSWAPKI